jgi:hypothetical protein
METVLFYLILPIYAKKKVCLSVCLFFMHFDTVRANATKLCRVYSFVQRKTNNYFLPKKIDHPPAKGRTIYLTNEIAAFGSIREVLFRDQTEDKSP